MSERLSIVISSDLKQRIDRLKELVHLDQSSLIRQILENGTLERQIEYAIDQYQKQKISLGQAVKLAEMDYWTFLDLLRKKNIPYLLDEEDTLSEIDRIDSNSYQKHLN